MKLIKLWRLAKRLQQAADRGDVMIVVPRWLAPELQQLVWERKVTRAAEKWEQAVGNVPLESWRQAVTRMGHERLAKPDE